MSKCLARPLLIAGMLLCGAAQAQEEPPADEDPAHEELRELRRGLTEAVQENDLDGILGYLHENAVITWLNGEQSRGHDEIRAYYNRMMGGDEPIVERYTVDNVEVTELTSLYGDDAGVAYGTAQSYFLLTDGQEFTVAGPWTATMVNVDGQWLVAAFHSSANMFDNPILEILKKWMWRVGIIAGVVGLVLGMVVVAVWKRRGHGT